MDRVTFGWWPPLEAATATKTDCITVGDGQGGQHRPLNLFVQKETIQARCDSGVATRLFGLSYWFIL